MGLLVSGLIFTVLIWAILVLHEPNRTRVVEYTILGGAFFFSFTYAISEELKRREKRKLDAMPEWERTVRLRMKQHDEDVRRHRNF